MTNDDLSQLRRELVAANRILAREDVVDAYGHVSMRHPRDPGRYMMSRSRSPALVVDDDLMEFSLDGTPINADGRLPYGERMIHGAIYEARPEVMAVVHNHSHAVIPFSISTERIRPVIHVAAIIGEQVPVWDIRKEFGETDMLVRTMETRSFPGSRDRYMQLCPHAGSWCCRGGETLQQAVLRAIYLQVNARLQTEAMSFGEYLALSAGEVARATETQFSSLSLARAWEYFCARAGIDLV